MRGQEACKVPSASSITAERSGREVLGGEAAHSAGADEPELLDSDVDHFEPGQYNDGGDGWQGQEAGEQKVGRNGDAPGTNDAGKTVVESGSHQSHGGGHAAKESCEKACERQCCFHLCPRRWNDPLISFCPSVLNEGGWGEGYGGFQYCHKRNGYNIEGRST